MSLPDRSQEIDHERPVWPQIAAAIRDDIRTGVLKAGARLPAEPELATSFGVARNTIRRAIEDLRDAGVLETFHGRGTYVR